MKIIISFLLFSISVSAQYPKLPFFKTIDSINTILYQTKKVRFRNQNDDVFNLRKINANKNGNVVLIDTLSIDYKRKHYILFNLFKVKQFIRKGNEIQVMDKNDQKTGAITNVEMKDPRELIKQLDALRFICILNEKEDPKFKCD